jgi:hypothetical protein
MATIRTDIKELLKEGLKQVLFGKYKEAKPLWKEIFNSSTSKKEREETVGFSGFGLLVEKPERTALTADDPIQGHKTTLTHKAFGLKAAISYEARDDDQYNIIKRIPEALATTTIRTEETYAARVFNNGFTTAGAGFLTGGDGKPLFATDHPLTKGGTYKNKLSTPAALTVTSFEEMMYMIRKTVGDEGTILQLQPKGLLVPCELSREATELLKSSSRPDVADGAINWAEQQGVSLISPSGWAYLTSPTAWFLICSKDEHNLEFITRNSLKEDVWEDHDTKDILFSVYIRFSVGFWDWRGVAGTEGA